MIRKELGLPFATLAIGLFLASPGFADLFALLNQSNEILRIDSTTGNVTETIPIIDFFPSSGPLSAGLAFDGRVLYLSRSLGPTDFLLAYDVVDRFWYPPTMPLPTIPNPTGQPQPISGLGILPDGYGGGSLFAVTMNPSGDPPSYLYQFYTYGPFFDFVSPAADPVALPANLNAQGADIDTATGELWISANQLAVPSPTVRLLHTDYAGNILETLSPDISTANLIRGLGFDNGSMFVAGRNSPTATNYVYEINRTTGEVIRSFALPAGPPVAALTGGAVIPEPECLTLLLIGLAGIAARRRR